MTAVEALQSLRNGQKVRRLKWSNGRYAQVVGNAILILPANERAINIYLGVHEFFNNDWEIAQ